MTSPSCDWAYSLIPTVAESPSFLTHSWVSANRSPLWSGIATPFPSFRMRPLVEGQRNHLRRSGGAANVHPKAGPRLGHGWGHVRHPDVVAKCEGDVARGHGADPLAVVDDRIAMTGNTAVQHFETHKDPAEPALAGLQDGVAPDEVLVEAERPIQARLERIGAGIDVVAMKAHACFQPQGVTGAEARRPDPVRLTFLEQRPPELYGIAVATKQLEAVFAGVAGPRDHACDVGDLTLDEGVVLHAAKLRWCESLHQADGSGTLHADQRPIAPDIKNGVRTLRRVRCDPVEVAVLVARIDHHQVAALGNRVDQDIIDDATRLVTEHGVLDPAGPEPSEVARDHLLGQALVFDTQLAHVREVEQPDRLTHRAMFLADAAVLERHDPATEVGHLGAEVDVFLVERCPLGRHDQTLRLGCVAIPLGLPGRQDRRGSRAAPGRAWCALRSAWRG